MNILSLGAGVQSTAVLLLAAEGSLPPLDAAIFADTGWEPKAVYAHLDRLEAEIARPAGIPILRVSSGNIRTDALDPEHRFASMPVFVLNPDGSKGITRRQCTSEYKLKPIKEAVRRLLGAKDRKDGKPGRVPKGQTADQWIGISLDEVHRAKDSDVAYTRNVFPLLDLKWTREHCLDYLRLRGWETVTKSACVGCPFHGNATWRRIRDEQPEEWAEAVEFDAAIRSGSARANASGSPLRGQMFLHRSLVPLDIAPIDHRTRIERAGVQLDLFTETEVDAACSPFSCRSDLYDMSAYEQDGEAS